MEFAQLADERHVSPVKLAQAYFGLGQRLLLLDEGEKGGAKPAAALAWLNVRPEFWSFQLEPPFITVLAQVSVTG